MSSKRFTYQRPDGSIVSTTTLLRLEAAAARRLKRGTGPFNVIRGDHYEHPGLKRSRALQVLAGIARSIAVGTHVHVLNKAGDKVFEFHRVANAPMYDNPLRDCAGLTGFRQDQGVDYGVSKDSPVYAIGPGKVTIYRTTSGWPWDSAHSDGGAYIAYEITEGPAKGLFVYDAEHIKLNPKLKVGSKVDSRTVIATHLPGFANCEMGWAGSDSHYGYGPGDAPEAVEQYNEGERTRAGDNFDRFMRALGAVPGLTEGRPITGTLPAKYPRRWKGKV